MKSNWKIDSALRHSLAAETLCAAGFSRGAVVCLLAVGIFTVEALCSEPWTDEDAGQRFVGLRWRLSVSPECSAQLLAQIERGRDRLVQVRRAA